MYFAQVKFEEGSVWSVPTDEHGPLEAVSYTAVFDRLKRYIDGNYPIYASRISWLEPIGDDNA